MYVFFSYNNFADHSRSRSRSRSPSKNLSRSRSSSNTDRESDETHFSQKDDTLVNDTEELDAGSP